MTDHELIANIHRRLDKQDEMLLEIRDRINSHIVEGDVLRPTLDEIVSLWKGSKILIPILTTIAALGWALIAWADKHVKL